MMIYYYITAVFILTISLLILMPVYFFDQVGAQLISPNTSASSPPSNTGTSVTSSSLPSGTLAPSIQLKSSIFEDLAKCMSARTCRPTMGSVGDDRILGGNGSNVIMGLEGNDIIRGGSGDNIIIGGPGDNQLYGGEGNNIILASGTGTNQIYGGSGNNILIAGQGSTLLVAGKGNDKLYGGGGNNVFIGGPGADYFACGSASPSGGTSKSVVLNFNATKGDDTDGSCGVVLGQ
ncbi:MAG: calcium-binding protein [Nitrososphaeraceae archaeon]